MFCVIGNKFVLMVRKIAIISLLILGIISLVFINACQKNPFTNDPSDKLVFSTDTVQFDTVFVTVGSSTNYFTVKNSNKSKSIKIDRIYLGREENSVYRLNIDGYSVNSIEDFEIAPGDSVFIFVEVTINPGVDDMIEEDSVVFISNGNVQNVKLVAFGQNITLINGQYISNDTTWTSSKPVLIYNSALVEENVTLTVQQGTNVYFHRGSSLFVSGTLIVHGEVGNRVMFTGDRLEDYYSEIAGQWGAFLEDDNGNTTGIFGGIHLLAGSHDNEIFNTDIKNGIIGLQVDSCVTPGVPTVKLKNTNIENSKIVGLYALGAHVDAENCVFANSGQYNVACVIGGEYSFIHCTLANYWVGNRQTPQLILNNYYQYYDDNNVLQTSYRELTDAYFGNCIIYGSREEEVEFDFDFEDRNAANFRFENCLIKSVELSDLGVSEVFVDNIYNESPKFKETISPYDYELDTLSPAKDTGKLSISILVPLDQNGESRLIDGKPDLGAFERFE